jgi:hypothetical protein
MLESLDWYSQFGFTLQVHKSFLNPRATLHVGDQLLCSGMPSATTDIAHKWTGDSMFKTAEFLPFQLQLTFESIENACAHEDCIVLEWGSWSHAMHPIPSSHLYH